MYVKVMLTLLVALAAVIALALGRPPSPPDALAGRVEVPNPLNTVIDEVELVDISLEQAVDVLRRKTGANIVVNWNEFEGTGIDRSQPVETDLRNVSLLAALRVLFDHGKPSRGQHGEFRLPRYDCEFSGGVVAVFNPFVRPPQLLARAYDVRDLLADRFYLPPAPAPDSKAAPRSNASGEERADGSAADDDGPAARLAELVKLVQRDPACADPMWAATSFAGGTPTPSVHGWGGRLIVVQTAERHRNIEAMLEALRRSR
jgi:hypothetical protein